MMQIGETKNMIFVMLVFMHGIKSWKDWMSIIVFIVHYGFIDLGLHNSLFVVLIVGMLLRNTNSMCYWLMINHNPLGISIFDAIFMK